MCSNVILLIKKISKFSHSAGDEVVSFFLWCTDEVIDSVEWSATIMLISRIIVLLSCMISFGARVSSLVEGIALALQHLNSSLPFVLKWSYHERTVQLILSSTSPHICTLAGSFWIPVTLYWQWVSTTLLFICTPELFSKNNHTLQSGKYLLLHSHSDEFFLQSV